LGTGTTVVVRLPHRNPDHIPSSAIGTVLIVDDEPAFRNQMTHLLTDFVERVVHATDGRAALDTVTGNRPDVIMLDLHMPGMSGRDVLTVLRQKPALRDIPVVVVTSAAPDGLDLSSAGLSAALLLKSELSVEAVRFAITEAVAVLSRAVPT
jgi:CheY-like chemotaxis protein